jgi:hypothetical protein
MTVQYLTILQDTLREVSMPWETEAIGTAVPSFKTEAVTYPFFGLNPVNST